MRTVHSKLFESKVAIVGEFEERPSDKVWFTEKETEEMKKWEDETKKIFFQIKQVFGGESTITEET